ncbi:ABC transporter ATP-binding protein [Denitrobaculum tricleocarpae]|uniref:ATP-binding cassette domain-containing protein n=1 Tax=Denitrobaculum tricleocarpae TaxID=2591009 RepID=A0A545TY33_9PROT|nr:oligopeptide/dipeptide ABC transporter ATP-binding protein [Denitrobaculum tricleocarpae]TQV82117.1 ATP-binding cassette domain-containing protein [Denitrobaculum tricleocarpae]
MTDHATSAAPLIEIKGVSKRFVKRLDFAGKLARRLGAGLEEETVHAVDGVDLSIAQGEVVGLVGESGCGKSTLGRMVAGIMPPSDGAILYKGRDIASLSGDDKLEATFAVQMIFQDPFSSLNPRMRVEDIIGEAPVVHGLVSSRNKSDYVDEVLTKVGLDPELKRRYPHQFSGGQRQRIGIARALAVKPKFLVCDEAIAALDVSIQAQVINLFMDLREEFDLTYLFISHDLSVVEHISERVVIMYLGRVVEAAQADALFAAPNHPYAQALLSEVPRLDQRKRDFQPIKGEIPSPLDPPPGCHFHPRCPQAFEACSAARPLLKTIAPDRISACHLND